MRSSDITAMPEPEIEQKRTALHIQFFSFLRQRILSNTLEHKHYDDSPESELEQLLAHFQTSFINPCAVWAASGGISGSFRGTVFYPFGGPDILFPLALFPEARELVLVGREPCELQSDFFMEKVTDTIRHYLLTSFFITEDLKQNLSTSALSSILPLILAQLHWAGYTPLSVDDVDTGSGLCIRFHGPDGVRRIHYFRQDLRNEYFTTESLLFRKIVASGKCVTFLKSASYLLHEAHFSMLRQLIKEQTSLLVQDPSGLPYTLLRNWGWNLELHGCFTSDIPLFAHKYDQSALRAAYQKKGRSTPLPFGFGYLKHPASAAVMVAFPPHDGTQR